MLDTTMNTMMEEPINRTRTKEEGMETREEGIIIRIRNSSMEAIDKVIIGEIINSRKRSIKVQVMLMMMVVPRMMSTIILLREIESREKRNLENNSSSQVRIRINLISCRVILIKKK